MNKLLISLLSLVGASAVGTGGYFLLRNSPGENSEKTEPSSNGQVSSPLKEVPGKNSKTEVSGGNSHGSTVDSASSNPESTSDQQPSQ